jgi:hypothetical protein
MLFQKNIPNQLQLLSALASGSAAFHCARCGRRAAKSRSPAHCGAAGWQLQDVAKVPQAGAEVAAPAFNTAGWYTATVPGTVLTTLVNNHVYPEPLYGENNRPESDSREPGAHVVLVPDRD